MKNKKIYDLILFILVVLFLLSIFLFVKNSINLVSEANQNNFIYAIKVREASEQIDKIVERAELNLSVLTEVIQSTYDVNRLQDENYNLSYMSKLRRHIDIALRNTPGVTGVWVQGNSDSPFYEDNYVWYVYQDGKIVDYKELLEITDPGLRPITPESDPYYFEALKTKGIAWSDIYIDADQKISMITLSEAIYSKGKLIGVAGIDISLNNLQKALINMQKIFKIADVFLVDDSGEVLLAQWQNQTIKGDTKFIEAFNTTANKEGMVEHIDNGKIRTAIKVPMSSKHAVIVSFPNEVVFEAYNRLFNTVYLIFAIMILFALATALNRFRIIRINKNLELEKNKLRAIIDASPNLILLKDLNGVYLDCNEHFATELNLKKSAIIGKTAQDIFMGNDSKQITESEEAAIRTKNTVIINQVYDNFGGKKVYFEKYIIPLKSEKVVTGLLIVAFDITKKFIEYENLKKAKEAAVEAANLKSDFIANVSHEIRTPLNGLLGFIQLLQETQMTDEQGEFVAYANKSAENLLQILNDILDFSKIEANKFKIDEESFDIRSVVEDTVLISAPFAESKGIGLSSLISTEVPQRIIGDAGRIKQILNNLINNAIKFTNYGDVALYVKRVDDNSDNLVLSFEVKDTGIGIEEDKLSVIFESFTQVDPSRTRKFGGTGLGLAITKKIVDLFGGTISVKSKIDEGTTFTVTLPFKIDNSNPEDGLVEREIIEGLNILIIDSYSSNLPAIQYYLEESKYKVHAASTIDEIFSLLNSKDISIILISSSMLNLHGVDIVELIKKDNKTSNIPLILYTTMAKRGDALSAKEKGFSGFLTTPIVKADLLSTINIVAHANLQSGKNVSEMAKHVGNIVTKHMIKETTFEAKAKILVVEDSEINAKLIVKMLNQYGLFPDLAENGLEALNALKNKKYDLIFMDCQMPIMSGYEATRKIRALDNGKDVPIIALTANVMDKDYEACFEAGMTGYLAKPISKEKLIETINNYISTTQEKEIMASKLSISNKIDKNIDELNLIIKKLSDEIGLDKAEAIELLFGYLDYLPQILTDIDLALTDDNYEKAADLCHKLIGTSENLRVKSISELVVQLKEYVKNRDRNSCKETITIIRDKNQYFKAMFVKYLN